MKILFYNHTGQVSGAERVMLMILARLDRKSFDPLVLCPAPGPLQKKVVASGVRTKGLNSLEARFTWRVDRLAHYLKSFFRVVRELRQNVVSFSPDLIHANSIRAGLVATAATFDLGTPIVWHLHDLLPRHPLSTAIRIVAALSTRTRMIAVSDAVARNFCGRLARVMKKRVSVILNGIDLERFGPGSIGRKAIRQGLGLNGATPVLGIVGQLTPRKGQLELLHAFARSLEEIPQAVLLIVGAPLFNRDHEYEQQLQRASESLGIANRVLMLGARDDIAGIMQALDLLVINSSAEPFGLVALEAMACGTPVLAAATGGLAEIVDHDKNGWLVAPENEQMLVDAIACLGTQPTLRARLAEAGRQTVTSHFSADRYLQEIETFYQHSGPLKSQTATTASRFSQVRAPESATDFSML